MAEHRPFHYLKESDFTKDLQAAHFPLQPEHNTAILSAPLEGPDGITLPNRIAFQAMEGCDGDREGNPQELTVWRYRRFASSGAGFIYVEASAVSETGRANPRQLMLTEQTAENFSAMLSDMRRAAEEAGQPRQCIAIQLTHSGRYSKDAFGRPAPRAAWIDPYRDFAQAPPLITDDELDELPEKYIRAAVLARQVGFDLVDIKSCHGYLLSELLSARTRQGKYGGSFENRTYLLRKIVREVKKQAEIPVMVRLCGYDETPGGFGVSETDFHQPDPAEPSALVSALCRDGISLLDMSAGNPYFNPHVNRPYDVGTYIPALSQMEQIARHFYNVRDMKKSCTEGVPVLASMFTWFRDYAPYIAAAGISSGWFDAAGFGRQSFAYPDFPKELLQTGKMERSKCCVCCGKCTALMRAGTTAGCVVRDRCYTDLYRSLPSEKRPVDTRKTADHI